MSVIPEPQPCILEGVEVVYAARGSYQSGGPVLPIDKTIGAISPVCFEDAIKAVKSAGYKAGVSHFPDGIEIKLCTPAYAEEFVKGKTPVYAFIALRAVALETVVIVRCLESELPELLALREQASLKRAVSCSQQTKPAKRF